MKHGSSDFSDEHVTGEKDIVLNGGANAAQQYLKAGLLDEINLHLVHVLLGEGIPLFENLGAEQIKLEKISVTEAPGVTHFRFRAVRQDTGKLT